MLAYQHERVRQHIESHRETASCDTHLRLQCFKLFPSLLENRHVIYRMSRSDICLSASRSADDFLRESWSMPKSDQADRRGVVSTDIQEKLQRVQPPRIPPSPSMLECTRGVGGSGLSTGSSDLKHSRVLFQNATPDFLNFLLVP